VWLQGAASYVLLRRQFKRKLVDGPPPVAAPALAAPAES
jgi:hypothetical protein